MAEKFENFGKKIYRFLQENLKIFQGNLVILAGKSIDFYKKIKKFLGDNLTIFS